MANRPGASGEVASSVARATPDGYTVMMAIFLSPLAGSGAAVRRAPAYELDQFATGALLHLRTDLLVVRLAPWRTLEEFIAAAKARAGAISFSYAGNTRRCTCEAC